MLASLLIPNPNTPCYRTPNPWLIVTISLKIRPRFWQQGNQYLTCRISQSVGESAVYLAMQFHAYETESMRHSNFHYINGLAATGSYLAVSLQREMANTTNSPTTRKYGYCSKISATSLLGYLFNNTVSTLKLIQCRTEWENNSYTEFESTRCGRDLQEQILNRVGLYNTPVFFGSSRNYLLLTNLTTLSTAQTILRRFKGVLENNELERTWKKVAMT
jgi:hypothetical protein